MARRTVLKVVNIVLLVCFLVQAGMGIFHEQIVLLSYNAFSRIHGTCGFILIVSGLAHMFLNRSWFRAILSRKGS